MVERELYGDSSANLAKTLKVMGTLFLVQGRNEEAVGCLNEALLAFELQGCTKLQKETLVKLKQARRNL